MEKVDWEGEKAFFNEILKIDTKNYNTWVYRFGLNFFVSHFVKTMVSEKLQFMGR